MAAEQEACQGSDSKSLIQEGDQVVLRIDKALKVVQVRKNRKILFERLRFLIDNAIDRPFGSVFEVKGDKLHLIEPAEEDVDELEATKAENGEKSSEYQPIKSDGQSQKLTRDDVDVLKSQGASGKEIVKKLVENSETFKDRTEFSKAKYMKKKHKKYNAKITVLKPSTRLIASMYYSRAPNKICALRPDALSQLLSLANIRANSNVIVMEQCQGLVAGAVLDRMGGHGSIVQIHSGNFPTRMAMECFGFSSSFMEIVDGFPLCKVNSLKVPSQELEDMTPSQTVEVIIKKEQSESEADVDETNQQSRASSSKTSEEQSTEVKNQQEKLLRRTKRQLEERKARNTLQLRNMDSLVVVCKLHPSAIVLELLEYVAPSRPFVIFSTIKEALAECYTDLRNRGGVVNLQLTETWWREYQVLPGRTHPLVNMDGSGGYLLSGTTVERTPSSDSSPIQTETPDERAEIPETVTSCLKENNSTSQTLAEEESSEPPAKKVKE
ncbi:tRNA (adenine(58)-N(1))-methyltransferase non-catalytic subunit TRM6-like [Actinia tenebrosa]|uniref:tRNA (adenine(58)-N(1))-methyltransferase non-catalytic subunit TRM6 n=1 Tax=Actinia tenebrosa TaxID=6105 RepID=A0A6P8HX92_ACTTE|nr:tRNA (adenine(58)-N(1))-methyltransferase non-catalytic subunit TRM6-like [Actinia tenebrosa]